MKPTKIGGFSEEQQDEIVKLVLSGETTNSVGRAFNTNSANVWYLMTHRGYAWDKETRIWRQRTQEEIEVYRKTLARGFAKGQAIIDMARDLNMHEAGLRKAAADLGWKYDAGVKAWTHPTDMIPTVKPVQPKKTTISLIPPAEPVPSVVTVVGPDKTEGVHWTVPSPAPVPAPIQIRPEDEEMDPLLARALKLIERAATQRETDLAAIKDLKSQVETLQGEIATEKARRERAKARADEAFHDAEQWRAHKRIMDQRKRQLSDQLLAPGVARLEALLEKAA